MISSRNVEKPFDKTQHPFMVKILNAMGVKETYFNIIKAIHYKLTYSTVRSWKQPECPLIEEWIRKICYIYTMEYFSAIKGTKFVEGVISNDVGGPRDCHTSEVSQKEKNKYCILTHIYGV